MKKKKKKTQQKFIDYLYSWNVPSYQYRDGAEEQENRKAVELRLELGDL